MASKITRQEDGTITLTITVPASVVSKQKEEIVSSVSESAKIAGFRAGKAPKKVVEERVGKEVIQEELIKKVLPDAYAQAIKEHNLRPIINPQLHIEKLQDGEDLVFEASLCETPIVELGDYKEDIKKETAKTKIIVPGKEKQDIPLDKIVELLLKAVKITVPRIIVEQETQKLLAQTLDEVKRLGLTLDQYLSSTGRSIDALRQDYEQKAQRDIALEFTLAKIAEVEKITVEEKEVEEAIQKAKDDGERKALEANRYLLAQILRQQKTLDFLRQL